MKRLLSSRPFWTIALGTAGWLVVGLLSGCCSGRTVTIPGATPPPTVVTETDTVYLATPAPPVVRTDTLLLRDTVRVTVPVEVIRYTEGRDESEPQYHLFGFTAADGVITFYGPRSDTRVKLPVPGEVLDGRAAGPDSLTLALSGAPRPEPDREVEVRIPDPLIEDSLRGWLTLGVLLSVTAAAFLLVGRMLDGTHQ